MTMLMESELAYLLRELPQEPPQEQTMMRNGALEDDNDLSIKAFRSGSGSFSLALQSMTSHVAGGVGRILTCLDEEAERCFNRKGSRMMGGSKSLKDSNEHLEDISGTSAHGFNNTLGRLSPNALQERHTTYLHIYYENLKTYRQLYLNVKKLPKLYSREKKRTASWTSNSITNLFMEPPNRKCDIDFILSLLSLLPEHDSIEKDLHAKDQSETWLIEKGTRLHTNELLLLGACVYVYQGIQAEYKGATPNSALHTVLLEIIENNVRIEMLPSGDEVERLRSPVKIIEQQHSGLNLLKERANLESKPMEAGVERLDVLSILASNKQGTLHAFTKKCEMYLDVLNHEKKSRKEAALSHEAINQEKDDELDDFEFLDEAKTFGV